MSSGPLMIVAKKMKTGSQEHDALYASVATIDNTIGKPLRFAIILANAPVFGSGTMTSLFAGISITLVAGLVLTGLPVGSRVR